MWDLKPIQVTTFIDWGDTKRNRQMKKILHRMYKYHLILAELSVRWFKKYDETVYVLVHIFFYVASILSINFLK